MTSALSRTTVLALASGASLTALPQAAHAQIVYSGPVSIAIPGNIFGVYINVVTGVTSSDATAVTGWDINPFGTASLSWYGTASAGSTGYVRGGGESPTVVDNLPLGTLVDAASPGTPNYTINDNGPSEGSGATAFALNSANNYVGFRFLNEGTGQVNYGWLQVQVGPLLTDASRRIIGYAFQSNGTGINIGDTGVTAVPEPGTYFAGLAAGALALRAWRRRRQPERL